MTYVALAALAALCAAGAGAEWAPDEFMISVWGGPTDEATAQALEDANFNTVMANADKLELCQRHGLKVIVMDATPERAAELADHPAVWGFYVKDEPPAEEFEAVAGMVAEFHRAAPNQPAYVNLMAWMPLGKYLETVKPRFLSYDYYQWWWGTEKHFGRLAAHRAAALEAGVPLICWVEANADRRHEWGEAGATYLPDNEPKLRQSVYTALAYGVKGIQWFNGHLVFQAGPGRVMTPKLRRSGEDIKQINADLKALGPTLVGLESTAVHHTDPVPDNCEPIADDSWVRTDAQDIVIGLFDAGDPTVGRYAMVVNRSIDGPRWVRLQVEAPQGLVSGLDTDSGEWAQLAARRRGQVSTVEFVLPPGDGMLILAR